MNIISRSSPILAITPMRELGHKPPLYEQPKNNALTPLERKLGRYGQVPPDQSRGLCIKERRETPVIMDALVQDGMCIVSAQHQQGKSSMRKLVEQKLRTEHHYAVVSCDLQGVPAVESPQEWWSIFLKKMVSDFENNRAGHQQDQLHTLSTLSTFVEKITNTPPASLDTYPHIWSDFINLIRSEQQFSGTTLLFDETDTLFRSPIIASIFYEGLRRASSAPTAGKPFSVGLFGCFLNTYYHNRFPQFTDYTATSKKIWLSNCTRKEFNVFLPVIEAGRHDYPALQMFTAERILDAAYEWTAGQPFLTRQILDRMVSQAREKKSFNTEAEAAKHAADDYLFNNLLDISSDFPKQTEFEIKKSHLKVEPEVLHTYLAILHADPSLKTGLPADQTNSVQQDLVGYGLCRWEDGRILVQNKIIATFFDDNRIQDMLDAISKKTE